MGEDGAKRVITKDSGIQNADSRRFFRQHCRTRKKKHVCIKEKGKKEKGKTKKKHEMFFVFWFPSFPFHHLSGEGC